LLFASAQPGAHAEGRILVLSPGDEAAYRAAFAAADAGDWAAVENQLAGVEDASLAGDLLARRYLSRGAAPSFADLAAWLADNADSPFAEAIYQRARGLRRYGDPPPATPSALRRRLPSAGSAPPGDNPEARRMIEAAAAQFAAGDLAAAAASAEAASEGPRDGPAQWQLGLIAFRTGDFRAAAAHFDAAAAWRHWDAHGVAAVRYWAARAHLAAGDAKAALQRFKAALAYPATFYGQLAEAQLGVLSGLAFTPPTIDAESALAFMRRHREARRAAALAQIGRLSDVETELKTLHARLSPEEDRVFLDFSDALAAPSAQLRAAEYGGAEEGWGFCPTTNFAPDNGFRLDRAALFAVARQESRYSPVAVSSSNARGLMQLLPSTAGDMDRSVPVRAHPDMLQDPGLNMRLGQSYLEWLMGIAAPDGDLIKLFAAYNGGPGWLKSWLAANPDVRDPLMILESLPRAESRDYAERVMANMGLCRKRFGQETIEFDELAAGKPAIYRRQDR
jgi:soluble lytic murein transglycosylase-like protein